MGIDGHAMVECVCVSVQVGGVCHRVCQCVWVCVWVAECGFVKNRKRNRERGGEISLLSLASSKCSMGGK